MNDLYDEPRRAQRLGTLLRRTTGAVCCGAERDRPSSKNAPAPLGRNSALQKKNFERGLRSAAGRDHVAGLEQRNLQCAQHA